LTTDIAARVALAVGTAQMVQKLRAEEASYRQIVEASLDGIWKSDTAGVTTFVNVRMAEILGTTPQQMIGQTAAQWGIEPDSAYATRRMAARLAGQSERYDTQLRRADGSCVWVHMSATPIRGEHDAVAGLLAMVSDISDRKRNEDLSRRLDQMQRLDSLGKLAGGIAHDFNNLLSIIGGFADLWRMEMAEGDPAREAADHIVSAVQRGAALTRQLLTFGRGQPATGEVLDLDEVLTALAPMLRRTIGEHIELVTTDGPAPAAAFRVRIDRGQLEQVVVNLAANARDAMPGGGRLSIEWDRVLLDRAELGDATPEAPDQAPHNAPDKAWFVRLAVGDSGQGMDDETLAHAFEPFYTTKGVGHGTGLGLAGVYGIVRNAGGVARLYSERGHGTTVKVYLPARDDHATQPPAASPKARPPGRETRAGTHVLVVEDAAELAAVVQRLLTREGYQVTICLDPAQALTILDAGLPADLIITDVVMPTMTGPELAKAIHQRRPDLPILYTSGYTAGILGDRVQLDTGAVLIEKPFSRATMLDAVEQILDQTGPGRITTSQLAPVPTD
jgi:PAS domain S-box-containing protein